jgi:hypothetical protein
VKNYSWELLHRLVPCSHVIQHGNALKTTITKEGLTQESFILDKSSLDHDKNDEEEDNIFASSLLVNDLSSIAMASARDILKPQINEVLQCLHTLKSKSRIKQATKLLNGFADELCLELGRSSGPKRNIENCLTVNMKVEESLSKKSRSYASKNC